MDVYTRRTRGAWRLPYRFDAFWFTCRLRANYSAKALPRYSTPYAPVYDENSTTTWAGIMGGYTTYLRASCSRQHHAAHLPALRWVLPACA